jgi:hypothetical protein
MFDLSAPSAITQLNTRNGDQWFVRSGSLTVNKTVLRFLSTSGDEVQIHVAEVASVVSKGSK